MFPTAPSTGFGPAISCVTGRRALQAAPRGHVHVPVAQVGVEPTASLVLSQGGLPVAYRAAVVPDRSRTIVSWVWTRCRCRWTTGPCFQVESPGVAPGSPACGAGVVLLDHDPNVFEAEAVGLEPTSGMSAAACFPSRFLNHSDGFRYRCSPRRKPWDSNPQAVLSRHLFSRQAPHPAGWLPLSSCGGWNRTNMKTFRASHPAVR